ARRHARRPRHDPRSAVRDGRLARPRADDHRHRRDRRRDGRPDRARRSGPLGQPAALAHPRAGPGGDGRGRRHRLRSRRPGRRGRSERGVEKFSGLRAIRAIERGQSAALVLDATTGVTAQDTHVAGYVQEAKKGLVIVVNKWDLIEKDNRTIQEYTAMVRRELNFVDWAPLLFASAVSGQRTGRILELANEVQVERD